MMRLFRKNKLYKDMSLSERQRYVKTFVNAAGLNGNMEVVKECINIGGIDVEAQKSDSYRAIHSAAYYARLSIVRFLVEECRVDIRATIQSGHTAMHIACWKGHLEIVRYFIEDCRMDINIKLNDTWTALHVASQFGHIEIVKYFIKDRHMDADTTGSNGWTALHSASFNGQLSIVRYLVDHCDVNIHKQTKLGQTAYTIARDFGKKDVAAFLKRREKAKDRPATISHIPKEESYRMDEVKRLQREVVDLEEKIKKRTDVALKRFFDAAGVDGNLKVVKECIGNGVNVETKKSNSWRALHLACCYGHLHIIHYLVEECNASVQARIEDGSNALHIASQYGHLNIVRYLIPQCQVGVETNDGWTALHLASGKGHLDVVHFLVQGKHLDVMTTKNKNGTSALHSACINGQLDVARYFIEECHMNPTATINNDGWTALHDACFNGHLHVVKYLIEICNVDVTPKIKKGQSALHMASERGHLNIVKYLVDDCGVDTGTKTNQGRTAFMIACDFGKNDVADYLMHKSCMKLPPDSDQFISEYVDSAGVHGDLDHLKECVERGVNVNAQNSDSFGAIHTSSFHGHLEIVMYLVEQCHVDVTAKTKDGLTALHLASANGHLGVIRFLVEDCLFDITIKDNDGWTAIHFACANGRLEVFQHIVKSYVVDTAVKVNDGWTALHVACANGHLDIVQFLVEDCDFDIHAETNMGKTACDIACDYEQTIVVAYLMTLPQTAQRNEVTGRVFQNPPKLTQSWADGNVNDEIEVAADCNKLKHLMIDPACDPTPFSLQYLKMCTDNFTSPVLGQGAFGTVFLGSDKEIGTNIAVKRIPLHIPDKELCTKIISSFSSELAAIKPFRHPNILAIYGYNFSVEQPNQFIVYEHSSKGSLEFFLNDEKGRTRLPGHVRLSIMFQLARTLHFMHSGGCDDANEPVFHRHIKSGNIFLDSDYRPKLIDCSLEKMVHENAGNVFQGSAAVPMLKSSGLLVFGTPGYICPVYSRGQSQYTATCDVFSLGVVFAELLVGSLQGVHASTDFFCRYIKDEDDEPIKSGWKILKKDADVVAQWNSDTLERLCKITVQCMTASPKRRISTLTLVETLCEISTHDFMGRVDTTNLPNAGAALSKNKKKSDVAGFLFDPCILCNRSSCDTVACISGHLTCVQCIEHEIQFRTGQSGKNLVCRSGALIMDDALSGKISPFTYDYYIQQRSLQQVFEVKLDDIKSVQSTTSSMSEEYHDIMLVSLKGIKSSIQRVLWSLAYVTNTGNVVPQCPTVVWLVPTIGSASDSVDDWKAQVRNTAETTYDIYFVCQHSFEVLDSKITVTVPRSWLVQIAPVLALSLCLLKKTVTIGGVSPLPFPFSTSLRSEQIGMMEDFVTDLMDSPMLSLYDAFQDWCDHGTELTYTVSSQLLALTGTSYEGIVMKAGSMNQVFWKGLGVPVAHPRGYIIWVKNDYRDMY